MHQVVRALAAGHHYSSRAAFPLVPGIDAVARTDDDRLVYAVTGPAQGAMSERFTASWQAEIPAGADPLAIAAGMNPGMSGWLVLAAHRREISPLGTVLVLGATGLSGSLAVQSAWALGAERVIAVGRDPEALERLRATGAVTVALTRAPNGLERALVEAIGDTPPALVLDYLWGSVAESAFVALARGGDESEVGTSYVQIGSMVGQEALVPAALLRSGKIQISGNGAGSASVEEVFREVPELMARIADGSLRVPYTAFPLRRAGEAWGHVGRDRAVVVPD